MEAGRRVLVAAGSGRRKGERQRGRKEGGRREGKGIRVWVEGGGDFICNRHRISTVGSQDRRPIAKEDLFAVCHPRNTW